MAGEGILQATIAGADVTVGTDHVQNELLAVQPMARRITKIAMVGSTAVNDCQFELMVGGKHVGYFQNTHAALENIDHNTDVLNVDFFVPANSRIQFFCRAENAGANPVVIFMQFSPPKRTYTRRTSYRRNNYRRNYSSNRRSGMR